MHQDPALLDDLTVRENIEFVVSRRRSRDVALDPWLSSLDLAAYQDAYPRELSPGVLRRVALARALCLEPAVLVADEPTTGLDPKAARDVDRVFAGRLGEATTLILITHDLRSLDVLEPDLCWVHKGRVAWQGPYRRAPGVHPALDALLGGEPYAEAA